MESTAFSWLVTATFAMLLVVTLGIAYITTAEWRDRRRRERK